MSGPAESGGGITPSTQQPAHAAFESALPSVVVHTRSRVPRSITSVVASGTRQSGGWEAVSLTGILSFRVSGGHDSLHEPYASPQAATPAVRPALLFVSKVRHPRD